MIYRRFYAILMQKGQGGHKTPFYGPPWDLFSKMLKNAQIPRKLPDFYWSHRALGMSDFCVRHVIRKEIVHTFHFLTSERPPRYVHTCGTQKAHHSFFQKSYQNAVPGVCLMCAYNVPGVCTYLETIMWQNYSIRAFQRTLARLFTTKTLFCSSI